MLLLFWNFIVYKLSIKLGVTNDFNERWYFIVVMHFWKKINDVAAQHFFQLKLPVSSNITQQELRPQHVHVSASALRYQEELMRLRYQNRQQQARKISLVNAARMLQHRGSQSRSRLSVMMTNNFKQEKEKTEDLEKVIWIRKNWLLKFLLIPLFCAGM